MYLIQVTYDTGDSFKREDGVEQYLNLKWENLDKAKKALKELTEHYHLYMLMEKEYNAGKKEKKEAEKKIRKAKWSSLRQNEPVRHAFYSILLENDDGERVSEHCFWCGYFEHLVGLDIISEPNDKNGLSKRF